MKRNDETKSEAGERRQGKKDNIEKGKGERMMKERKKETKEKRQERNKLIRMERENERIKRKWQEAGE
jgi:hypothetical protein